MSFRWLLRPALLRFISEKLKWELGPEIDKLTNYASDIIASHDLSDDFELRGTLESTRFGGLSVTGRGIEIGLNLEGTATLTAKTGHSVKLEDGRQFDTMCAIDSLGCASTFHMDCEIFSFCKDTGESVYIEVSEQEIKAVLPTTDLFVSYFDNVGGSSCDYCGIMDFFQFEENALNLLKQYENDDNMYFWTLNDAFMAAKMVFVN